MIRVRQVGESSISHSLKLVDLVEQYPVSQRLRNLVLHTTLAGSCPFYTVGELLAFRDDAVEMVMKAPGFGKGKAEELVELVVALAERSGVHMPDAKRLLPEPQAVADEADQISVRSLLNQPGLSVALHNSLRENLLSDSLPFTTLNEYVSLRTLRSNPLQAVKGFGAGRIAEFDRVVGLVMATGHVAKAEQRETAGQQAAVDRESRRVLLVQDLEQAYPSVFYPLLTRYKACSVDDLLLWDSLEKRVVFFLENRDVADLIKQRYLGATYDDISLEYGFTKQRAGQVLNKYKNDFCDNKSLRWAIRVVGEIVQASGRTDVLPSDEELYAQHCRLLGCLLKQYASEGTRTSRSMTIRQREKVASNLGLKPS